MVTNLKIHFTRIPICTLFFFCAVQLFAQYDPSYKRSRPRYENSDSSPLNAGVGIGLNYGGIGTRLEISPQKNFAMFGAAGFNLHKIGFNVGAKVKIAPDKKVSPMLQFMYGYNAVIVVYGASQNNETYYGPSIGGGIELKVGQRQNFFEFGLVVPFRDQQFADDIRSLRNGGIDITEPPPIAISAGFHFKI